MDVDRLVATRRPQWDRLRTLTKKAHLTGPEADEFVELYGQAATDLSTIRSAAPDPALVAELSTLVARARGRTTGTRRFGTADISRYFLVTFPLVVYRARWWVLGVAAAFVAVSVALGIYIATNPDVQLALVSSARAEQLVSHGYEDYYSSSPATSFAANVWTHNAWVAALCLAFGGLLGIPVVYLLWANAANLAAGGALMASAGRLDFFFGLILPHGLLELTAVFIAAALGLRLGWSWVAPGERTRVRAFAEEGRSTIAAIVGLTVTLLVSGVIEAFVTPSGLPTWARIGIGVVALSAFIIYVGVLGRRAAAAGIDPDLDEMESGARLPAAG
jgi:uncharacterized membrane protein SpoIIM required for sporulation